MNSYGLMAPNTKISLTVPEHVEITRIDKYLVNLFPLYSRTFFTRLIDEERILINDSAVTKSGTLVKTGDIITVQFPPERLVPEANVHERIPSLEVVHEDEHFLVVYKPAGLLVHAPSSASTAVTLVDWLLVHYHDIKNVGYTDRPGIIHRLDKDTSGVLIVSRTNHGHKIFGDMFRNRTIKKTYYAVVQGHPPAQGTVDLPIGRDPIAKTKMTTKIGPRQLSQFRDSVTHYRVIEYFNDSAFVEVQPVTGRTHQIRVHMASIGHAIIGDPVYGQKSKLIKRHALHAYQIAFMINDKPHEFSREIPEDFQTLLDSLRRQPIA